jgi:transcriptional regulator with XRE-family HTH domain
MDSIGGAVKRQRKRLGMTQSLLARKAGVDVGTVSRLERAETRAVSVPVLRALAAALELDPADLVRAPENVLTEKAVKARQRRARKRKQQMRALRKRVA